MTIKPNTVGQPCSTPPLITQSKPENTNPQDLETNTARPPQEGAWSMNDESEGLPQYSITCSINTGTEGAFNPYTEFPINPDMLPGISPSEVIVTSGVLGSTPDTLVQQHPSGNISGVEASGLIDISEVGNEYSFNIQDSGFNLSTGLTNVFQDHYQLGLPPGSLDLSFNSDFTGASDPLGQSNNSVLNSTYSGFGTDPLGQDLGLGCNYQLNLSNNSRLNNSYPFGLGHPGSYPFNFNLTSNYGLGTNYNKTAHTAYTSKTKQVVASIKATILCHATDRAKITQAQIIRMRLNVDKIVENLTVEMREAVAESIEQHIANTRDKKVRSELIDLVRVLKNEAIVQSHAISGSEHIGGRVIGR